MSTCYRFIPDVSLERLKKAMAESNVSVDTSADEFDRYEADVHFPITDGHSFMWMDVENATIIGMEKFGRSNADFVYNLAAHMGVDLLSEHEDGFFPDEDEDEITAMADAEYAAFLQE